MENGNDIMTEGFDLASDMAVQLVPQEGECICFQIISVLKKKLVRLISSYFIAVSHCRQAVLQEWSVGIFCCTIDRLKRGR